METFFSDGSEIIVPNPDEGLLFPICTGIRIQIQVRDGEFKYQKNGIQMQKYVYSATKIGQDYFSKNN